MIMAVSALPYTHNYSFSSYNGYTVSDLLFFLVHYSLFTNEISHFDAAFYFNLDFWRVFFSSLTFSVSCFVCHRLWLVVLCLSFFEKILLTIFYLNVACVVICLRLLTLPFYIKEIMCTSMQNIFLFFVVYHLINAYVR